MTNQVLVTYEGRTTCVNTNDAVTAKHVLSAISARHGPPVDLLCLSLSRLELSSNHTIIPNGTTVSCKLKGGLLGGKGGFGAQLRASGKVGKKVSNFSACRDLNGRRLRHVNNEIRLRKWHADQQALKRAKERGGSAAEIPDSVKKNQERTKSGIPNWYLGTPAWAELGKNSMREEYEKPRNLELCNDWVSARAAGKRGPPAGAPVWWGCPRGKRCTFAHGVDEMSKEGKVAISKNRQAEKKAVEVNKMKAYSTEIDRIDKRMASSVAAGLANAAKTAASVAAADLSNEERRAGGKRPRDIGGNLSGPTEEIRAEEDRENGIEGDAFVDVLLECTSGEVGIGLTGEVQGRSQFGSACTVGVAVTTGVWYYEAELMTDGVMQIGWASDLFNPDQTQGDGVGDVEQSWSFDGSRRLLLNEGKELRNYGTRGLPSSSSSSSSSSAAAAVADKNSTSTSGTITKKWQVGDVVGVCLDLNKRTICFAVNDKWAEPQPIETPDLEHGGRALCFFPAISLEEGEAVRLNLGKRAFKQSAPTGAFSVAQFFTPPEPLLPAATDGVGSVDKVPDKKAVDEVIVDVDLDSAESAEALQETYGLASLKVALAGRGLKSGGSLVDRAQRLFAVKGLTPEQYDKSMLIGAKPKKKKNGDKKA